MSLCGSRISASVMVHGTLPGLPQNRSVYSSSSGIEISVNYIERTMLVYVVRVSGIGSHNLTTVRKGGTSAGISRFPEGWVPTPDSVAFLEFCMSKLKESGPLGWGTTRLRDWSLGL